MKALSIRQPWAWFILADGPEPLPKPYENRDWSDAYARAQMALCPPGSEFLIHASAGMTKQEFKEAVEFAMSIGVTRVPQFEEVKRGGIVGMARHEGLVRSARSRWFAGRLALKLVAPYPLPFRECKGALGFFEV